MGGRVRREGREGGWVGGRDGRVGEKEVGGRERREGRGEGGWVGGRDRRVGEKGGGWEGGTGG